MHFFEIFDFQKCHALEITAKGQSRSLETKRIDPPHMTSY